MGLSIHELAVKVSLRSARLIEGTSVTYTRGATTITINHAIQSGIEYTTLSQDGSEAVVEVVPWLIDRAALTLGEPQVGDLITRTVNDVARVYTVEFLGIGQNFWDWTDTSQTQYIIRTREDGAAAYKITQPNGFDLAGEEMRYG